MLNSLEIFKKSISCFVFVYYKNVNIVMLDTRDLPAERVNLRRCLSLRLSFTPKYANSQKENMTLSNLVFLLTCV